MAGHFDVEVSIAMVVPPIAGWFRMEIPFQCMIWRYPHGLETSMWWTVLMSFLDVSFADALTVLNPTNGIRIQIGFHIFISPQPAGGSCLLPSGLLLLRQVPKTVDRGISQAGADRGGRETVAKHYSLAVN